MKNIKDLGRGVHYVATTNVFRGPWYVVEAATGNIQSQHDDKAAADNDAYRLDKGNNQ